MRGGGDGHAQSARSAAASGHVQKKPGSKKCRLFYASSEHFNVEML